MPTDTEDDDDVFYDAIDEERLVNQSTLKLKKNI